MMEKKLAITIVFALVSQLCLAQSTKNIYTGLKVHGDITTAWKIGIGTTTPTAKLHIFGDDNDRFRFGNSAATGSIYFGNSTTNPFMSIGIETAGKDLRFFTANVDRLAIKSTGNVGISNNTPTYKLSVSETAGTNNGVIAMLHAFGDAYNNNQGIGMRSNSSGAWFGYLGANPNIASGQEGAAIVAGAAKNILFLTEATSGTGTSLNPSSSNNQVRMFIENETGNVGIGTTAPSSALHVNGVIKSHTSGMGYVGLYGGGATQSGYIGFFTPDGIRRMYIGWGASDIVQFNSENGAHPVFNTAIATPYYTTNANITLGKWNRNVEVTAGTVTLPNANIGAGIEYFIRCRSGAGCSITNYINAAGTGVTTIPANSTLHLVSDGRSWLQF